MSTFICRFNWDKYCVLYDDTQLDIRTVNNTSRFFVCQLGIKAATSWYRNFVICGLCNGTVRPYGTGISASVLESKWILVNTFQKLQILDVGLQWGKILHRTEINYFCVLLHLPIYFLRHLSKTHRMQLKILPNCKELSTFTIFYT